MNDKERAAMVDARSALKSAEIYFRERDVMNAEVHLSTPRWSPITELVGKALISVMTALEHEGGA